MELSSKIYSKTGKGTRAASTRSKELSADALRLLSHVDGKTDAATIMANFSKLPGRLFQALLGQLESGGYIRLINAPSLDWADDKVDYRTAIVVDELTPEDYDAFVTDTEIGAKPTEPAPDTVRLETETEAHSRLEEEARAAAERLAREEAAAHQQAVRQQEARRQALIEARLEAEHKIREAAVARFKADAEARTRAEEAAKVTAERLAKEEEVRRRAEAEAEARARAEAAAQAEAERLAREEARRKEREEQEARRQAEEAARLEAERKAREQAERQAREAEEARQKAEAEASARAEEAERRAREAEDARQKAEAEARAIAESAARLEAERKSREEEEARRKAEEAARQDAERLARMESRRKSREEKAARRQAAAMARTQAKAEAKLNAERLAREDRERTAREAEEARQKAEAEARALAEEAARLEAERKAREEAELKARVAEEARLRAEAEARAKAGETARLEAERKAVEEAAALRQAEAEMRAATERAAREEAKRQAREEKQARRRARAEARAKAKEEARQQETGITVRWNTRKRRAGAVFGKAGIGSASVSRGVFIYAPLMLILLLALVQFVNLGILLGEPMARFAAASLGEPVRINEVHASLFPRPQLILAGVAVGSDAKLQIESIRVRPNVMTLFDEATSLDMLEIERLTVDATSARRQMQWLRNTAGSGRLKVERVTLRQVKFQFTGVEPVVFDGQINLLPSGDIGRLELISADRSLTIQINPKDGGFELSANAHSWQPPLGTALQFSEFTAQGVASGQRLRFNRIEGRLYGGTVQGQGVVDWSGQPRVSGNFKLDKVSLSSALAAIGSSASIEGGVLRASASFSSRPGAMKRLTEAAEVQASFVVTDGRINGVDLAASMLAGSNRTPSTRFDRLSGSLQMRNGVYQYRQLALDTDQFHARGQLDIQPDQQISGKVSAQLLMPTRRMQSNVSLTGKLGEVRLQ